MEMLKDIFVSYKIAQNIETAIKMYNVYLLEKKNVSLQKR